MKNATKHAETLRTLYKKLAAPDAERPGLAPLSAIVLGVLRENCDDARAGAAMDRFGEEFVDVNELRVATELELADLMGEEYPDVASRSSWLRELLMALFDGEGRLSLDRLAGMSKKEQRAALREVPLITPFVEAHAMVFGFNGSAVPVDARLAEFLCEADACEADTDAAGVQRFVEQHLRAEEYWPFYAGCRRALSETAPPPAPAKSPAKSKARAVS